MEKRPEFGNLGFAKTNLAEAIQPDMNLNPRNALLQFGHLLQQTLFPAIEVEVGPLSKQMQLLASVVSLVPLERLVSARRSWTGRPAKDRAALATAFIAKAVLNLPTTRDLTDRLRVDEPLRKFCGWANIDALPHESKFSRAFAEFAATEFVQQLHEAVIAETQRERLIGHIARDSTAIAARERFPETAEQKEEKKAGKKKKAKKGKPGTKKPSQLPKVFPVQPTPQLAPAEKERFKERTMVERVNARWKDEFGASHVRVRGAAKVMTHLMFGVLALTVDQWLRLRT